MLKERRARMNKQAGFFSSETVKNLKDIGLIVAGASLLKGGIGYINELRNDTKRKALIEDLIKTDPVLKDVDHDQLMEWYATIYHFAPKFSLDRSAVREVLQNFARFGRLDINTIKMIADTEKSTADAKSKTNDWGGIIQGIAAGMNMIPDK